VFERAAISVLPDVYTKGHSEKIIGDHIARDRSKRDRLVIATKFSSNLYPGDPNGGGSSRKSIVAACEQSLRRLQTDYIDLYWLHNWDKHTPIEETMAALHDLVRAGKVRYLGVSDTPAWKVTQAQLIAQFRGWTPFIGLQLEYSLLERTVEGELIPMAGELGLGVTPWSPLKSGILSGKYTPENAGTMQPERRQWAANYLHDKAYAVIDELQRLAGQLDTTVARVALAWVQGRPGVVSTILGARTLAQLVDSPEGARCDAQRRTVGCARRADQADPRLPRRAAAALHPASRGRHHHQRRAVVVGAVGGVRRDEGRRPLLVSRPSRR
jgi:aryl-alcohol dehydrogenase-like predicted oxidoreductase